MKTLYSFFILLLLFSCSTRRHTISYVEHLNAREEGDQFIDSLKTAGVDTIIGYYDGCSGCTQGREKSYYVFWDSENKWHLTKFTNYSRYNHIAGYSPPINYISSNIDSIENGKLTIPSFEMSHYTFDIIRINLGKKEFKYEIKTYEKLNNESAQKVILIDKIRSALFKIQPHEWVGISYKKGKFER